MRFTLVSLTVLLALAGCSSTRSASSELEEVTVSAPVTEAATASEESASESAEEAPAFELPPRAPDDWHLGHPDQEGFRGAGVVEAYRTVLSGMEPRDTVVVAVIDSGIDVEHDDLDDVIWTNDDEIPGNGVDDDGNGYVDDVHGWNFIGGPDGRHVDAETFEITREYGRLAPTYAGVDSTSLSDVAFEEYVYFRKVERMLQAKKEEWSGIHANTVGIHEAYMAADSIAAAVLGHQDYSIQEVAGIEPESPQVERARSILLYLASLGVEGKDLLRQRETLDSIMPVAFDTTFNSRTIVGDDQTDPTERIYGNNDVAGPDPFHGTHVAGIIAAERGNTLGMDGIAAPVKIMVVRTVPNGDERDKDVANAIRYAVDNGATVVNMSFGKELSPHKEVVDAAVRHAAEHDVLLVHGAGNDSKNIDSTLAFPSRFYLDGEEAPNWLEVGASSWQPGEGLPATFSNYGARSVDLFAPGVDIYSTAPDQSYEHADGTSMASPVVAGVAALVRAYFPELSAEQVRSVLVESASPFEDQMVIKPGTQDELVPFGTLSHTGGLVDAAAALRLAAQRAAGTSTSG